VRAFGGGACPITVDEHATARSGPGAAAITIHVYSPPIRAIGHYDLDDGQLCRILGLPDEPSPPSAALCEALNPGS
jgi:hypothetical protein